MKDEQTTSETMSFSRLLQRAICTATQSNAATTKSFGAISTDLYKESNLKCLVEKFKKSSELYRFRTKTPIYENTVCLITLYGKSGMFENAQKVFDEMPDKNSERTVLSSNAFLGACVNSKKFDKGELENSSCGLQLFSQILAIMEPRDLMDMFSLCMPELFECIICNTQLVHIFSTLLQAPKVYRPFADVLVNYLVNSKLDALKHPDTPSKKLVLQLFQFIFGAVPKAPSDFERILQPHVPVIMEVCMKNATEVKKPLGYMKLLHATFRALALLHASNDKISSLCTSICAIG